MGGSASSHQHPQILQPQPQHHASLAPSSSLTFQQQGHDSHLHPEQEYSQRQQQQQQQATQAAGGMARPATAARPQLYSDFFRKYELTIEL